MSGRKVRYNASITSRLTLLMFILGGIALVALSLSIRIANDTKGSAYMINQLGLLRMKSYQLLTIIPLSQNDYNHLNIFKELSSSKQCLQLFEHYGLTNEFNQLQNEWISNIAPKIQQAKKSDEVKNDIDNYVDLTSNLVHKIDQKTEKQIHYIFQLQLLFIVIIILSLIIQISYLRRYILVPWQKLIDMAEAISKDRKSVV